MPESTNEFIHFEGLCDLLNLSVYNGSTLCLNSYYLGSLKQECTWKLLHYRSNIQKLQTKVINCEITFSNLLL